MSPAFTPIGALVGGLLIGLAATVLMLTIGRIAGISGIVGAVMRGDRGWPRFFLLGVLAGAGAWLWLSPLASAPRTGFPPEGLVVAGLLVGYGTRLGSGCTSGHGVCGMARFSARSFVAVATFLPAGFATVFVVRHLLGGIS